MHTTAAQDFAANPFAMLLDPAGVAAEVARSDRLQRLRGRIYRPLDKPLIAHRDGSDLASFDDEVDATEIAEEDLPALDDGELAA